MWKRYKWSNSLLGGWLNRITCIVESIMQRPILLSVSNIRDDNKKINKKQNPNEKNDDSYDRFNNLIIPIYTTPQACKCVRYAYNKYDLCKRPGTHANGFPSK